MKKHKYLWAAVYGLILFAFTLYCVLDTFVIVRIYEVPDQPDTAQAQRETLKAETETEQTQSDTVNGVEDVSENITNVTESEVLPVVSENSYSDGNITITLTEYEYMGTQVYAADVVLSSPEYLKTALAKGAYGKNVVEKTSVIAAEVNAILAINGDYYGARESGYVIRNGTLYRSRARYGASDLVIFCDGSFKIIKENDITAEELLADGAYNVFSFGPALVEDGKISVTKYQEVGQAMTSNPRTAIGIIDDLHYIFIVADGRTGESDGLSLYELAAFAKELGAVTAYNLDGGGSSTMVFNGSVVNNPTTNGKRISERSVSDIVYIGY